jgi:hypothetical protein
MSPRIILIAVSSLQCLGNTRVLCSLLASDMKFSSFPRRLGPIQLPAQWITASISAGFKRPRHKSDHAPILRAEAKNTWSYTSTPSITFMAFCLIKQVDKFTFTYSFTIIFLFTSHCTVIRIQRAERKNTPCQSFRNLLVNLLLLFVLLLLLLFHLPFLLLRILLLLHLFHLLFLLLFRLFFSSLFFFLLIPFFFLLLLHPLLFFHL